MTDVLIVGAGPTGLMLAGDLAAAGVRVKVLERRVEESNLTRAFAVHARMLELLDMRGLADTLVSQGLQVPEVRVHFRRGEAVFDLRHPDSRFPYVLVVRQARTEALLEQRARDLGVEFVPGAEVAGLCQDEQGVTLTVADGRSERAAYAVGCDGAHSAVRRLLGVRFSGRTYGTRIVLADARFERDLPLAVNPFVGRDGVLLLPPYGDGWYRATIWDRTRERVPLEHPVDIDEVRDSVRRITGDDLGLAEMGWSTRFLSERRQADRYRVGRVLLAGDAAHVHSPLGAMGMSTGVQDAANLSWKLAAAVHGWAPPWLLDTYHTERHRAGRTSLRFTDLLMRLAVAPAPVRPLRSFLAPKVMNWRPVSERVRRTVSGLGVAYPVPAGVARTPSAGTRVPDLALAVGGRKVRLYELARGGRFLLIDTGGGAVAAAAPWQDRAELVPARGTLLGTATALLVRPDGYLAWSADHPGDAEVRAALTEWCAAPGRHVDLKLTHRQRIP
jgi:2-polyprenyl-6-methoxyphenol hydroxylase-like FAD-dependent oxidoreductase